jgi:hypothetical protein
LSQTRHSRNISKQVLKTRLKTEETTDALVWSLSINRMIAEELTEYLIASQIDVQGRLVLDRL